MEWGLPPFVVDIIESTLSRDVRVRFEGGSATGLGSVVVEALLSLVERFVLDVDRVSKSL